MDLHWLIRMARWARNPPSDARVKLILAVIALCVALLAIEHFIGWPDMLTVDRMPRRP